jgi:hypothetical protein
MVNFNYGCETLSADFHTHILKQSSATLYKEKDKVGRNTKKNRQTTTPISNRRYNNWCNNDLLLWFSIFNYRKFCNLDVDFLYCQQILLQINRL